ncbi:MAG: hypothetical protein ABTQ25_01245 [Nitrosomonas ureae]
MSMFQISGRVMHVYDAPARKNEETGELGDEKPKVQMIGDLPLPNGQVRFDLVTLSIDDKSVWEQLRGQLVSVALGIFAPAKGQVIYFIPKGCVPRRLTAEASA